MKDDVKITLRLVEELIVEQFPQYANLPIRAVELSGIDNRSFRLGEERGIRLPSAEGYAAQVEKEQAWLPKLSPHLSVRIPQPIAMGEPNGGYPWNWSIYQWIEGDSANSLEMDNLHLEAIAADCANFIKELHKVETKDGPPGGLHNYYRGASLSVYDGDARADIEKLSGVIDAEKALAVWERAISSKWGRESVWVHGDFSSGNILIKEGKLVAVIDFGCMGVGDPACDLVIAWTFFKDESRQVFKDCVGLDADTWARARGWALWKAGFELVALEDKRGCDAMKQLKIINAVLGEY